MSFVVRAATLDDVDALVGHRIGMFTDMGSTLEPDMLRPAFAEWLRETMPSGAYRAWVAEDSGGRIVAGGGATIIPWPPGPRYPGNRLAFVYNVYVEHAYRRRGLARRLMDAIHEWCRDIRVTSDVPNGSR